MDRTAKKPKKVPVKNLNRKKLNDLQLDFFEKKKIEYDKTQKVDYEMENYQRNQEYVTLEHHSGNQKTNWVYFTGLPYDFNE